jgi:hypothetical protein
MSRTKLTKKTGRAPQRVQRHRTLPEATAEPAPAKISGFAVGDRVSHPQFGDGVITAIQAHKLTITFDTLGSKQIIDSYVKRHKHRADQES